MQMCVANYRLESASVPRENAYLTCSSIPPRLELMQESRSVVDLALKMSLSLA